MNSDGSYSLEVEPDVPYIMNATIGEIDLQSMAKLFYHNYPAGLGNYPQITVGPNETALIDIGFVLP
jgi:hypothetical protein